MQPHRTLDVPEKANVFEADGWQAGINGAAETACPWQHMTREWVDWFRGYDMARNRLAYNAWKR